MNVWAYGLGCGTVFCIGGLAEELAGNDELFSVGDKHPVNGLFHPKELEELGDVEWDWITVAQAARALRSYLTTGDPRWGEAVA